MNLTELEELYRSTLLDDVIPWWIRHGIDPEGPINTCIADDGRVISRDRWNWSQWRAVWIFSKLYNHIEHNPHWLRIARDISHFAVAHGPLPDGHWPLLLDEKGQVTKGYESIYVDGFAIYALTELYRATGEPRYLHLARRTYHAAQQGLAAPCPPAWPLVVTQGLRSHPISMIFSLVFHELADVTDDAEVRSAALVHHRQVMDRFLRPDSGLVLEWTLENGDRVPGPQGAVCIPGHAIESMWFQIHIARDRRDIETIQRAVRAIRTHLERGWDSEYGGLSLAIDVDGRPDVASPHAEKKLWWPHTEALYATLLAFEHCREPWCIEWHERIRQWSYAHYPVAAHGEWRQKLDRQGHELTETLFLPVKDPFHLPRALLYSIDVLTRLNGR